MKAAHFLWLFLPFAAPAQMLGAGNPCDALDVTDSLMLRGQSGTASIVLTAAFKKLDSADIACARRLTGQAMCINYYAGYRKTVIRRWEADSARLWAPILLNAFFSDTPDRHEQYGPTYAGLSYARAGQWARGGALLYAGLGSAAHFTPYINGANQQSDEVPDDVVCIIAALAAAGHEQPDALNAAKRMLRRWKADAFGRKFPQPRDGWCAYYFGQAYLAGGDAGTALPLLQQLEEEKLSQAELDQRNYLVGRALNDLGRWQEAFDILAPLYARDSADWIMAEYDRAEKGLKKK